MSVNPLADTTESAAEASLDDAEAATASDIGWALPHAEWLRRLIARRIQPLDCGEEVLQEVWLAASRSDNVPAATAEQTPWLARVAIRQSALALRRWLRQQRREAVYAAQQTQAIQRASDDPLFSLLADETRQMVRQQVQGLPAQQRELLHMKYVNGLTYRQIARRTGMDLTAVEYQLAKARKGLRGRLVRAGIEGGSGDE